MSLEQAIHTRYGGDAPLTALVPAERFFTGPALSGAARPYITLERTAGKTAVRTSSHTVEEAAVRFRVFSDGLDELKQISAALAARFDGQSFVEDGATVVRMRKQDHKEQRADDGVWKAELDYTAVIEE